MTEPRRPDADRALPARRDAFPHFAAIATRWGDNDVYGHVNNAVYYFYFDTLVNRYLIERAGLDFELSPSIAIVVETGCRYHRSFAFPDIIEGGLRVTRLGTSSVAYAIGLFAPGEESARVEAHFVHVYVDRATRRPVPLPAEARAALQVLTKVA